MSDVSLVDTINFVLSWLFLLLIFFTLLAPFYNYARLKARRLALIQEIERKYGWRVITMIHRQERIGLLGLPIYRFIDIEDSEAVIRAIRNTPPGKTIALILHTPGGLVIAAAQIAKALKDYKGKKIVIVPHYAMSGGTLIALAADEIIMDPHAVLGPLDPQIVTQQGSLPAPSILRAVEIKGPEKASDIMLVYADIAKKSIAQMKEFIVELLEDKVGKERAKAIADMLAEGYYTHDYPLTVDKLRKLGLPIRTDVPPEIYELMELYPQAPVQRPGIEYIPYRTVPEHRPIPAHERR